MRLWADLKVGTTKGLRSPPMYVVPTFRSAVILTFRSAVIRCWAAVRRSER